MLGSVQDAEDALQDALLAAWQRLGTFEGRSSIRTWLYRVATNRCFDMRRSAQRRGKVDGPITGFDLPEPSRTGEVLWLQPYPDAYLENLVDRAPGPDALYETREAVSLAFITALQLLPPRQGAVCILRDVVGFHAREVAEMLYTTEESVTSALKRGRATLRGHVAGAASAPPPPRSLEEHELVERFTRAFSSNDVEAVVALLTENVVLAMPPIPFIWQGKDRAALFMKAVSTPVRHLVATRADGQPAVGLYVPDPHTRVLRAIGLLVLTLSGTRVARLTRFDTSVLGYFNLACTVDPPELRLPS